MNVISKTFLVLGITVGVPAFAMDKINTLQWVVEKKLTESQPVVVAGGLSSTQSGRKELVSWQKVEIGYTEESGLVKQAELIYEDEEHEGEMNNQEKNPIDDVRTDNIDGDGLLDYLKNNSEAELEEIEDVGSSSSSDVFLTYALCPIIKQIEQLITAGVIKRRRKDKDLIIYNDLSGIKKSKISSSADLKTLKSRIEQCAAIGCSQNYINDEASRLVIPDEISIFTNLQAVKINEAQKYHLNFLSFQNLRV